MIKLKQIYNEIKMIPPKYPRKIKIWEDEDIDKYPVLKNHIIIDSEARSLYDYLQEIADLDYRDMEIVGLTIYDAAWKFDNYGEGYLSEWFTTIINGIFPFIITDTPYGSNEL